MSDTGTTDYSTSDYARVGALRAVSEASGGEVSRDPWQNALNSARQEIRADVSSYWTSSFHQYAWLEMQGLTSFFKDLQNRGWVDQNWLPTSETGVDLIRSGLRERNITMPAGAPSGGGYGGATTAQRIDGMMANMRAMALAWNVEINDTKLRQMATTAVNGEYNQQQALNLIGQHVVATAGASDKVLQGQLGQWYKDQANAYGVQMSDASIKASLNQWVQGLQSQESIQAQLLQKSKALYPHLSQRFDNGETFEQIIDPYREYAAQLLEKDPNQLSFVNSELAKAVTYNPDGKGNRTMTVSEFGEYVRSNSSLGYQYTNKAISDASLVGEALTKMFGRI